MTLLITLGATSAIHHSSDYRLSCQGVPTETANGAKQLSVRRPFWTAAIGFTGIATDGQGYVTRDWLAEEGISLSPMSEPEAFAEIVAGRGTEELRRVTSYPRRLSIVIPVATLGRCRLFLVSNFEEPLKTPRGAALDILRWFEIELDSHPVVLVHGASGAVPKSDKRLLREMYRRNVDPRALRARLAATNRRAASQRGYAQTISQGCWVTSIFADGHTHGENYGEVPGIPGQIHNGLDISGWVRKFVGPSLDKGLTVRQSAQSPFAIGNTGPQPEVGEPRTIQYSTPNTSLTGMGHAPGAEYPRLVIEGVSNTIELRKNAWVKAVLNKVTFEIDPARDDAGDPVAIERLKLSNVPTVGGSQPINWDYWLDLHIGGATAVAAIRMNAVAMSPTSCGCGLDVLEPTEELLMVAPSNDSPQCAVTNNGCVTVIKDWGTDSRDGLILYAQADCPMVSAEITAWFLLRERVVGTS
jgi:hypothetical protein